MIKKLILLPTWLIVKASQPHLPADHPWKGKEITLDHWTRYATGLCVQFGAMIWFSLIMMILMIVVFITTS